VYFSREPHSTEPGGRLNFINFETDRIDDCVEFMKQLKIKQQRLNGSNPGELCVMATGGGAYKFYDKIREALDVDVLREDEMECLIIGMLGAALPQLRNGTNYGIQDSTFSSPRSHAKSLPTVIPIQCTSQIPAPISTPICS
jgi:hypothetical protein